MININILIELGKTVPLSSLPIEEQEIYFKQMDMVSEVAELDFPEDDEWQV